LFRKFSILWLSARSISSTSTGFGDVGKDVSIGWHSSTCDPGSRGFLCEDMWGSFLALCADPRTKTNFCSSSLAMVWSVFSRAWSSTLVLAGSGLDYFMFFIIFDSIAFMDRSSLISRVSIRSVNFGWF
jgi:hypothetical protein